MAMNEQQKQIQTESQSSKDQSLAGGGYLGQKLGLSGGANPNGCVGAGPGGLNRCIFVGKEVTPPKLIAELNATALGTKISRAGFGSELNDVVEGLIGAVVTGLLNNMTNFLGMKSYSQLLQTGLNAFDESGANQPVPSNLYNPQTVCEDACNADYNSCMQQNSPAQNASASGNYTGVCSDALNTCIANCSSQTVTPAGQ